MDEKKSFSAPENGVHQVGPPPPHELQILVLNQAQASGKQKEPAQGIKPVHENGDLAVPFNHFAFHGHPLFIRAQPRGVRL
jgi:hypothetical protein